MKLKYQKELNSIENCPVGNETGEKLLFRCVESELSESSFIPNAVLLKPKYQDICMAWGLSMFNNYDSAKEMLNNLSKKKLLKYTRIAKSTIKDEDGIKHCTKNKSHYTFYPVSELDLSTKFVLINEE